MLGDLELYHEITHPEGFINMLACQNKIILLFHMLLSIQLLVQGECNLIEYDWLID